MKTKGSVSVKKRAKVKRHVSDARLYIQATFNNTMVTVTDIKGNVLAWSSSGSLGFKGAKKATPYAAQMVVEAALSKVKDFGLSNIHILVKGPGVGRESAIRAVGLTGLSVKSITDITPIPHNGCRPRKSRRV